MGGKFKGNAIGEDEILILVDTSVWIDFFAGANKKHAIALERILNENENVCTCGLIMAEILQGIRPDSDFIRTENALKKLTYLAFNQEIFIKAAAIYRFLRKKGITLQSPIDCIIASLAIHYKVQLLHNDRDFDLITKHTSLLVIS